MCTTFHIQILNVALPQRWRNINNWCALVQFKESPVIFLTLVTSWFFFGHRPKYFWNDRKKLSHFGQNVWKYMPLNTVTASFDETARQMTEMFPWPKCRSKKWPKCPSEKKQVTSRRNHYSHARQMTYNLVMLFKITVPNFNCKKSAGLKHMFKLHSA